MAADAPAPAAPGQAPDAQVQRFLQHLRVERRLAQRTLTLYQDALGWLCQAALDDSVPLAEAQGHHLRRWTTQLRERGLGSRSIAIALAAWRGLYKYWGREGLLQHNPVKAYARPRRPSPCPRR